MLRIFVHVSPGFKYSFSLSALACSKVIKKTLDCMDFCPASFVFADDGLTFPTADAASGLVEAVSKMERLC